MKNRSIKVDDFLWEELDKCSKMIGQSKSALVRNAVIEKLQRIHNEFLDERYALTQKGGEMIEKQKSSI